MSITSSPKKQPAGSSGGDGRPPLCSVVVPAHDEAAVIDSRLGPLVRSLRQGEADVVVVANGCCDDTAAVARTLPGVRVVELETASKSAALNAGDARTTVFPRIYLDADVRLDGETLRRLAAALDTDRALVAAPRVAFDVAGASWVVRAFHEVFGQLPYTRENLVGLGMYGLSRRGRERFASFPDIVADDLFVQSLFSSSERLVIDGEFHVVTPRTLSGLLAVRTRVVRGNRELRQRADELGLPAPAELSTPRALLSLMVRRPGLIPAAAAYVAVNLAARRAAAGKDGTTLWERDTSSRRRSAGGEDAGVRRLIDGVPIDALTEEQVVDSVMSALAEGRGGRVMTPNVDIHRQLRGREHTHLLDDVDVIVADGMPLLWASHLAGRPLAERVTGSSLIWSLTRAAAAQQRRVYLLGAAPGVAATAAARLQTELPGLVIAGTYSPPLGFESSTEEWDRIRQRLVASRPDIVFVGLGFPKQERLMAQLRPIIPGAWLIGCGAAIDFAAGHFQRAPLVLQRTGLEWAYRLALEPRRLFRRYIVHDVPHALGMLVRSHRARKRLHEEDSQ